MITGVHCSEVVRQIAKLENWSLEPTELDTLANRILSMVGESTLSDDELSAVICNYYRDGPKVEALLDHGSIAGEQLWQDIRMIYLKIGWTRQLDLAQAEDLAQTALEKTVQNLAQFQFRSRLNTWLSRIWLNAYAETYRHIQAKKRGGVGRHASDDTPLTQSELSLDLESDIEIAVPHEDYNQVDSQQASLYLFNLLAEVLVSEDVIILRRYYVEQTYMDSMDDQPHRWTDAAIAQSLGQPPNTVTSRRRRALERLASNPAIRKLAEDILGISLDSESDWDRRKKN